jgi:hypothetical protein
LKLEQQLLPDLHITPRYEGGGICAAGYSVALRLSAHRLLGGVSVRFFRRAPALLLVRSHTGLPRRFHRTGLPRCRRQLAVAQGPGRNWHSVARIWFLRVKATRSAAGIERPACCDHSCAASSRGRWRGKIGTRPPLFWSGCWVSEVGPPSTSRQCPTALGAVR